MRKREEVLCWIESGGTGKETRKGKKEREFWAEEKEERGREKAVGTARHAAHLLDPTLAAELAGARAVLVGTRLDLLAGVFYGRGQERSDRDRLGVVAHCDRRL